MRNLYLFIICILVVGNHQMVRIFLFPFLENRGGSFQLLPFFNLVEVWNKGISFGLLKGLTYGPWILSALSLTIIFILFYCFHKTKDKIVAFAYSFIIAGALGNVLDRISFAAVADYLDFHAFGYHWPAFNFTDISIVLGTLLLLFEATGIKFFARRKAQAEQK